MSFIGLQFGQCGNQLGHSFFSTISEISAEKRNAQNSFFLEDVDNCFFTHCERTEKKYARSVLFDSEPKVIEGILRNSKNWTYRNDSFKLCQNGAGNNWAVGYIDYGPAFEDDCLNVLRKEVERCDELHGFLSFFSVAGGTGSGVGSYLAENLRDHYPSVSMACITVWPFQGGEVPVQSYNSVLTLAALQRSADAIIILENDWLLKICHQKMGIKKASMHDLNTVANQQLTNLLLPLESYCNMNPRFNDMLAHLVPHPQYKLVGLHSMPQEPLASLPFSAHTWSGLLRSLRRMVLYNSVIDEIYGRCTPTTNISSTPPVSLANLLILRGRDSETADSYLLHKPSLPYTSWVPNSSRLKTYSNPNSFLCYDRSALLANNGQLSVSCVDTALSRAWKKFHYKAYFHHYTNNGLSEDDFTLSMMIVEQIVASYKSLAP